MPGFVLRYSVSLLLGHALPVSSRARVSQKPPAADLSQNEQAYARLQERLTTLKYKPGDYLNTAVLMNDLALGRTPINHALHRLSNEGLVQIIPRKGVMVSPLSIDDALDLITVRSVNEALCVRLTAARITLAELNSIRGLAAQFDSAVAERDMTRIMNCDRLFHEAIAEVSRNQVLIEILKVLHARSQRFWAISLAMPDHLSEVQDEHRAILKALTDGDAAAAEAAVQEHVMSFQRALLRTR
ncbi:GntR family transcriptional regulator [Hydrogenophaga sp.]|uniref:GntR family transcriptional regulator n=1 Tax=Hydrogenophaga sp. TaxID=1904254 RepID=UPI002FCA1E77